VDRAGMTPAAPSFREALRFWLKLGFISFGGPAGQIAVMHRELVERMRWISEKRFLHALNYCMVLPGPEAQQLATYIGWLLHGTRGGIVAGALFVLPSLFILIALSWLYMRYGDVPVVNAILHGIKPAVVAIVLAAAWRIGSRSLRHPLLWAIAAAAFLALFVFSAPFPLVILGAALLGIAGGRIAPHAFASAGHAAAKGQHAPSVIDDDTPTPPHAHFDRARLVTTLLVFLSLWGVALATLAMAFGWEADFTQMGWFFTRAALVTFGGAYAVLPYVLQGAVEDHGWITATQMIDGSRSARPRRVRSSWWWRSWASSAAGRSSSSAPSRFSSPARWAPAWPLSSPSCRHSFSSWPAGPWSSARATTSTSPRRSPRSPRPWWA
jgi:chromate transporter